MILILEGVDGSGKTTLATKLMAAKLFDGYIHVSNPEPGEDVFWHHFYPARSAGSGDIVDRLHWSDDVYGAVLRGGPGLTPQQFGFIDGFMASRGAVMVLCSPPLHVVLANIDKEPDGKNHNDSTAMRVWDEYQAPTRSVLPVLTYDYTTDPAAAALIKELMVLRLDQATVDGSSL